MEVWFAIPVADGDFPVASATFKKWHTQGYKTAALVECDHRPQHCDFTINLGMYKGWAWAVNRLAVWLDGADWIVTGGADVWPDPYAKAGTIAAECMAHFGGTFGVMQPTGDAYGALAGDPIACVSPWLGREWCDKAYGGTGPLYDGYKHYYADAELLDVSRKAGRLWMRPDLTQYHDHYLRRHQDAPAHLDKWQATVAESRKMYEQRKAEGFPGAV